MKVCKEIVRKYGIHFSVIKQHQFSNLYVMHISIPESSIHVCSRIYLNCKQCTIGSLDLAVRNLYETVL